MNPDRIVWIARVLSCLWLSLGMEARSASSLGFATPTLVPVEETAAEVVLAVLRTGDLDTVATVEFATVDSSATAGTDYTSGAGTLAFEPGQAQGTIRVRILNDAFPETAERFTVRLSNPSANATLGPSATATVAILDNDPGIQVEWAGYWVDEGAERVTIAVTRGVDEAAPATVDYTTRDQTAAEGSDYEAATGTLRFAAGERTGLVCIRILNDGVKEASEAFQVLLKNPGEGIVLGSVRSATVTIRDNDPGVHLGESRYWVSEGTTQVGLHVRRGNDRSLDPFVVDYATTDATALAGRDYVETRGTLAFGAGELQRTVWVPVLVNPGAEADRNFKLTLTNPSPHVELATPSSTMVTILDMTGTAPHRLDEVRVHPDGEVRLRVGGGVHRRFENYFALCDIEVSDDLLQWTPLGLLPWMPSSATAPTWVEPGGGRREARFYRVRSAPAITPFVAPSGSYSVGRLDRWVTDPARHNRFFVSTNSSFQVSVWYPAVPKAGSAPLPWADDVVRNDSAYYTPSWMDRWPHFVSYARGGLELAASPARFPVVLLSNGLNAVRHDLFEKADELASHGFIVVAPDHFDAKDVVLPDGSTATELDGKVVSEAGLKDRVADLQFLADQLDHWNDDDPMFAGRLDLSRISAIGFSWGGATAAEFCRADSRCRAVVALDPGGFVAPLLAAYGLRKPSLTIHSSQAWDQTLFAGATKDALWFQVSNTTHPSIGGWEFWTSGTRQSLVSTREINRSVNAFAVWFLKKYGAGVDGPMPALEDHPRLINFRQK